MTEQLLRAALADESLVFQKSSDWGAGQRHQLRLAMADHARLLAPGDTVESISNLEALPTHPRIFFSASHATGMGGFLASLNRPIGFDIETLNRVSEAIASRIASAGEHGAPSPTALWCAKEAAFKCFANAGIKGLVSLASVYTEGWTQERAVYRCEARVRDSNGQRSARGLFYAESMYGFCFFSLKPNLRQAQGELVR